MKTIPLTAVALTAALSFPWHSVPSAAAEPEPGQRLLAAHSADRAGDRSTTRVLDAMTKRLDLTVDQQQKAAAILEETKIALKAPAADTRTILRQSRERINGLLTPEQKGKAQRLKQGLAESFGGFAKAHAPAVRERTDMADEVVRLRAALSSLNLTDEQRGKLKEVEKDLQAKSQVLMDEIKPRMQAVREEARGRIRDVLTPEQQEQLKLKLNQMTRRPDGTRPDRQPRASRARKDRSVHPEALRTETTTDTALLNLFR